MSVGSAILALEVNTHMAARAPRPSSAAERSTMRRCTQSAKEVCPTSSSSVVGPTADSTKTMAKDGVLGGPCSASLSSSLAVSISTPRSRGAAADNLLSADRAARAAGASCWGTMMEKGFWYRALTPARVDTSRARFST